MRPQNERGDLTAKEQDRVRTAIRFMATRCGSRALLAKAIRYQPCTLRHVLHDGRPVTASLAFRIARLAEITVDDLLAGKFPPAGTCPHCGHTKRP